MNEDKFKKFFLVRSNSGTISETVSLNFSVENPLQPALNPFVKRPTLCFCKAYIPHKE